LVPLEFLSATYLEVLNEALVIAKEALKEAYQNDSTGRPAT